MTHGPQVHADGTTTFRLWAPNAERVDVMLTSGAAMMETLPDGWWHARLPAGHADRYTFRLDGEAPLPDPASWHQPDGVHDASALVDPRKLSQTAPPVDIPLSAAVIYELHVGTFTDAGTFDAAITHLPDLVELGVSHVEIMPVNAFNGDRGWGYDGVGWYAVHAPYGGPEGFARFIDAAHHSGLGVILDVVYNHLGPSGNYLPQFGPYLTDLYATPWGDALNLDGPDSDPVRTFVLGNVLHWLAVYGVDGLRLDAVHGLVDTSATHIVTEIAAAAHEWGNARGRAPIVIAESDRADPATILPPDEGGQGCDGQWADDLHHAIHTALTGEDEGYYVDYTGLEDVAEAYRRGFVFDGRYSEYRRRTVGAPLPDHVEGWRLVGCIQNHDQVGNRAAGERLTTLVSAESLRIGTLLLCAAPYTPMLFMGEEYGETNPFCYFTSHPEPELALAVTKGRRDEFAAFTSFAGEVPDPQDPDTFVRSHLDRSRADTPAGREWTAFWSDLLELRRTLPALSSGRRDLVDVLHVEATSFAAVRTGTGSGDVLVAVNIADESHRLPMGTGTWSRRLSTASRRYGGDGHEGTIDPPALELPGRTAELWHRAP